ncbi:MAG: hypothetical protein ACRDCE_08835 [Cetobacterium sp.]|uniref:hypothetical protein n=1 Tax=Cetobacterium sp. TaxID=2071632 RepID=UPI003EE4CC4D
MPPVNVQAELSNYRKAYGLVQNELKKEKNPDQAIWSPEQLVQQGGTMAAWGSRMEMPEELPNYFDDRSTGDPVMDEQNFQAYLAEHPLSTEKGDELIEMVKNLSEMVKDPENPMTLEDAMAEYTQRFTKAYEDWEKGGQQ